MVVSVAGLHRVAYSLLTAVLLNCSLVNEWPTFAPVTTNAALAAYCASRAGHAGLGCYFQPVSSCLESDASSRLRTIVPSRAPLGNIREGLIDGMLDRVVHS